MTIASLIVDVAANTAKLQTDVNNINTKLSSIETIAGQVGTAIGGAFAVDKLLAFGNELLRMGDEIVKVADRTGLTTEEVQKLQYIADQSGNTIDDLTGSIGKLQKGLTLGDQGAVAAVKQLGLNLDTLKQQTPYQQMETIATAIAKVEDPAQRATLAVQLFGKSGTAILPTLISQFSQLGAEAPVMSDNTVRALDAAGDSISRFQRQIKVWAAEIYNVAGKAFDYWVGKGYEFSAAIIRTEASLLDMAKHIPGMSTLLSKLGIDTDGLRKVADQWNDTAKIQNMNFATQEEAIRKNTAAQTAFEPPVKKVNAALQEQQALLESFTPKAVAHEHAVSNLNKAFERQGVLMPDLSSRSAELFEHLDDLDSSALRFNKIETDTGAILGGNVIPMFGKLAQGAATAAKDIASATTSTNFFKDKLSNLWEGMSGGEGIKGLFKNIGGGMIDQVGRMITGGIASLIGAGVNALGSLFKKIFGDPEKEINPVREAYVQAAGGLAELNRKAFEATGSLDLVRQLLNAKNVDQYTAAIKALDAAFADHAQDVADLQAAIEKYGFTIDQLGPAMRKQQLDDQAKTLINDWRLLVDSGIDVSLVNEKMSVAMNDYLHLAMKTGTEVPAAMQPILQKMIDQGLLTDDAGNKITDLKDSGIHFAETMTQGFDRVVSKLQELLDRLGMVPKKIADIPSTIDIDANVRYHTEGDNAPGAIPMAGGGFGRAMGPTLFFSRGNEDFAFSGEGRSFSSGGGGESRDVQREIQQLREEMARDRANDRALLPILIRDAVLLT